MTSQNMDGLDRQQIRSMRQFIRFAEMGVLPSASIARRMVELVEDSGSDGFEKFVAAAASIQLGTMPAEDLCRAACAEVEAALAEYDAELEMNAYNQAPSMVG